MLLRFLLLKTESIDGIPNSLNKWSEQLYVSKPDNNGKKEKFGKSLTKIFGKEKNQKEYCEKHAKIKIRNKLMK